MSFTLIHSPSDSIFGEGGSILGHHHLLTRSFVAFCVLASIVLRRKYIPLMDHIHTLVNTALIARSCRYPSSVLPTFNTLIFAISQNSPLTLRFQIARIFSMCIWELYLQLVVKVIMIR